MNTAVVVTFYMMVAWVAVAFVGGLYGLLRDLWRQKRKSREYWRDYS